MAEAPNWVLFEHAVGYTLFKIKEFEDIGSMIPEVCNLTQILLENALKHCR